MAFRKRLLFAAIWFATIWFATIMVLPGIGTAQTTLADVFDDSVLHEVRITMPAANWQTLKDHYLDNTYYNVDSFQWTGAPGKTLTVNNLTVR